jgi:hypothetical protein
MVFARDGNEMRLAGLLQEELLEIIPLRRAVMRRLHCLLVMVVTVVAITGGTLAWGQQSAAQAPDEDRSASAPRKADPAAVPPQQNDGQIPASGEATTQEAKSFSGNIVKENGKLVLKDPVTKVIYKLDDAAKAKQYEGKRVKVTGKLDMNTNTIHVESIAVVM